MTTARRVVIERPGGPEELRLEEFALPPLGPGQASVRHTAIGVNFIDTYHRSGLYPLPSLPHGIGMEAAGVVLEVQGGPDDVTPGTRVVCVSGAPGAYASHRIVEADRLIPIPDDVSDEVAAALALKGMTVEFLVFRLHAVQPGEFVLWHGAAGGVGLIACEWLKSLGARMIGTVGSAEKVPLAAQRGCEVVVDTSREDFLSVVKELTHGAGVSVVYDGVGKTTFDKSLDALKPRGLYVGVGNASGKPDPLDITRLAQKGSLFVTRPTLFEYTRSREELLLSASRVFDAVGRGVISAHIGQRFPLAEARAAHEALQSRRTVGSSLLLP